MRFKNTDRRDEVPLFFHVILTTACNMQCSYCYGEALEDIDEDFSDFDVDYSLPSKINYDLDHLARFCERDKECVLTFYGGEPLICPEEIKKIMNRINPKHFMVQTNGTLLDKLEPEYTNRFHTILVSVDGNPELTNHYRGSGAFEKVVQNLKLIRNNGFHGEIIARMTVMEQTEIYEQVRWLLNNEEFPFTSVHWQLNAGFWKNDFSRRNFETWSRESYNPGVAKLVKFWVDFMEKEGKVVKLYPFLGLAQSFLHEEKETLLRCGGGWINYAIQTDGYIIPCPTMWGMRDYYLGHVSTADPLNLKKIKLEQPCSECATLHVCGGRCLYSVLTKRWNPEAYRKVCDTVENLIESVRRQVPRIEALIRKNKITITDFDYIKYNGCEIIP